MSIDEQPGLLILGSFMRTKTPFFDKAHQKGLRIFSAKREAVVEHDYCAEVIPLTPHNFDDLNVVVDAIVDLAQRYRIDGIVSPTDFAIPALAHAAARLGLAGPSIEVVNALRNKHAMRSAFTAAGLPSARSTVAHSLDEARQAAESIGYPVVVKPTEAGGSAGASKVAAPSQLPQAVTRAIEVCTFVHSPAEFVVEECLVGPLFSVESVTFDGKCLWQGLTAYEEATGPMYKIQEDITPAPFSSAAVEEIYAINKAVNRAFGIVAGVVHTEYRLTENGPRLIEINPRVGGVQLPRIHQKASGIDLIGAAIDCAIGVRPKLEPTNNGYAGNYRLESSTIGTLRKVSGVSHAMNMPNIDEVIVTARPGQKVGSRPPTFMQQRLGFVFGQHSSYQGLRTAMHRGRDAIHFEIDPDARDEEQCAK